MSSETVPPAAVAPTVTVTVVHAPACHFCEDAEAGLAELAARFALDVRVVGIESPEGQRLVAVHRPAMNPLVLVDGEYFSSGRLPRKKLVKLLERRGVGAPGVTSARVGA
ncbi:glutaredoxin [Cellulomonas hominis]